jgi:hypothetical protein
MKHVLSGLLRQNIVATCKTLPVPDLAARYEPATITHATTSICRVTEYNYAECHSSCGLTAVIAYAQEIVVFPNDVSHSVQAVFFVLAPGDRMRLEQLRGGHAKLWQVCSYWCMWICVAVYALSCGSMES